MAAPSGQLETEGIPEAFKPREARRMSLESRTMSSISASWTGQDSLRLAGTVPADQSFQAYFTATPQSKWTESVRESWLGGALDELDQVCDEAREEGIIPPSRDVIDAAERTIMLIHSDFPGLEEPAVCPAESGDIEIAFAKAEAEETVLIVCRHDGSGACFTHIRGKNRRARYDDSRDLPDAFVLDQLSKLQLA